MLLLQVNLVDRPFSSLKTMHLKYFVVVVVVVVLTHMGACSTRSFAGIHTELRRAYEVTAIYSED